MTKYKMSLDKFVNFLNDYDCYDGFALNLFNSGTPERTVEDLVNAHTTDNLVRAHAPWDDTPEGIDFWDDIDDRWEEFVSADKEKYHKTNVKDNRKPSNGHFLKDNFILKVTQEVHYIVPKHYLGGQTKETLIEEWFTEYDGRSLASKDYCRVGYGGKTLKVEEVKEIK